MKARTVLGTVASALLIWGCPSQQQETPPATQDTTEADTAAPQDTLPGDADTLLPDTAPES
ncbi:MAG: hypothetical protein ACLFTW_10525 [Chitinispirillaceae bacterium]